MWWLLDRARVASVWVREPGARTWGSVVHAGAEWVLFVPEAR